MEEEKSQLKIFLETLHHKYMKIVEQEDKIKNAKTVLKQLTNKDVPIMFDVHEGEVIDSFDLYTLLGKTQEQDDLEMWTGSRWCLFVTTSQKFEERLKDITDRTPRALDNRAKNRLDRLMSLGFTRYQVLEADRDYCVEAFLPVTTNYVRCYLRATFYIYEEDC